MSEHELVTRLRNGERRALARAISLVEQGGPTARALLAAAYPYGSAHRVGITGPPGAGKSTLVTALAQEWRKRGVPVGIVAVDPSSPFSGGAVLGDRIRMQALGGDPGVFIRSMASRGRMGGLARATADAVTLIAAAGFPVILIETVGAGQDEVDIAQAADTTIVVEVPGMGDDVQSIKAGMLEIADVFVVNKADRPGVDQTVRQLRTMLNLGAPPVDGWMPPVLTAIATTGEGCAQIVDAVEQHRQHLIASNSQSQRALSAAERELTAAVQELVLERLRGSRWSELVQQIAARQRDPYAAANELLTADVIVRDGEE
ncbi:MAG TPA: methylmalonyl Co-A mutase-associated GTPase MeaB [Chloroflexus aurantiacus]|jgi:LAO/AO transport system kinase|uniref:LAO/AO transport system ATPase n=1 Tax=Chloroflexus aurantiacus (strain ATCC 29366 / DSM 635 / J-10-fl) TaxID=324602 RepID=A9WAR9_CHLAA|nr:MULTISPECIES: methylmalonyl Co-A mutase-associated GTPase MeaB [Chloroflexus]ABY33297.1 LAO/AO transport system ATPase [Chloroflexus aurantiacus J-10-fl]RMG51247.1 MAG: methylmalonyl Co-A mutase-associated GTPase MeaB [Chloroflexota bacterium]HBW66999.1 methylmalonyl Co-A mutase-associated GTPase MeaB [Chloroflexus aurantiacus]